MLNFLPLKTGGGVQVAFDFLNQAKLYGREHHWYLVARDLGPFASFNDCKNITLVKLVPDNLFSRLFFEYFGCKKLIKKYNPDLIYTQFGPHWPGTKKLNIAGCAYSNLFYPELDFWGALPCRKKWVKLFIDRHRLKRVLAVDEVIFETEDLKNRAISQYQLKAESVHCVKAAVSSLVGESSSHEDTRILCESIPEGFRVVLLSGYHPNKNIELLVRAAAELKKQSIDDVVFVTTLPLGHPGTEAIAALSRQLGVEKQMFNLGPIPQAGCVELYRVANAAILPSKLESFSNMIAESWATNVPLLISDLSWARSLCGDGAIYFDYNSELDLASKIIAIKESPNLVEDTLSAGSDALRTYPSSRMRFEGYLEIISDAHKRSGTKNA
jgi:glycosyltransferase involved in cell wall biosynthesis